MVADLTSTIEISDDKGVGGKVITVKTPATAVSADTFTVDLAKYGYSGINSIKGSVHTTKNSVVVDEAPTTSVTSGTLTVTVGGSAVTKKRFYEIRGN